MRVSILNVNLVGPDAVGQSILNQIRYFQRRGDEVEVVVMYPPRDVPPAIERLVRVTDLGTLMERHAGRLGHSDLYIFHYPSYYPLVESMRSIDRGKVVFFYHNVTPSALWGGTAEERLHLDNSRRHVPALLPYADLIVTPSAYNARELVSDFDADEERVRVLPLAVDLAAFAPRPGDEALRQQHGLAGKQVLLFVGRMAGNKRVDLLVEALHALKDDFPALHLVLAGDDRSNAGIQAVAAGAAQRAASLGLADRVHVVGPVDDVAPWFNLADIYVSASVHEGFGVPLIEAMASGVPIVASDSAAHPLVVGDAGLLVPAEQPAAMAEAIARLLRDDELYGEMVKRGLARSRDFSSDAFNKRWGEIVAEIEEGLPPSRPLPPMAPVVPAAPPTVQPTLHPLLWLAQQVEREAKTMQHDYHVRSGAPLVGPVIGWVRRNLTSHLREPYVDPTFERQEQFNLRVARLLNSLVERSVARDALYQNLDALDALSQRLRAQADDPVRLTETLDALDDLLARLRHTADDSEEPSSVETNAPRR